MVMFVTRKRHKELKRRLADAEHEANYYTELYDDCNNLVLKLKDADRAKDAEIERLKKANEELQHKVDILYQYYDIQKDPTQEQRTQIRIDMRVHELEMENIYLKSIVDADIRTLRSDLALANARMLAPYRWC
jgi:uncharacterized protein YigA (DUF484 family)